MKFALVDEIHEIDRRAVEEFHIPEMVLMENAGAAVFRATVNYFNSMKTPLQGKTACVVIGSGNNGGDGLVVARYLANYGVKVSVFVASKISNMTDSTKSELDIVNAMGIDVRELETDPAWSRFQITLRFADVVIDGILGTGLKAISGNLKPNVKKAVDMINAAGKIVVAIDVPTGVLSDSGSICDAAIKANLTVTLAAPKFAHFICPAMNYVGKVVVNDIGLPPVILKNVHQSIIDYQTVKNILPSRARDAHKGSCGKILVIAGSRGMTGAAALASQAAVRIGAGLVTLAIPKSLNNIMEQKLTEVMTVPITEANGDRNFFHGFFGGEKALETLLELQKDFDAVLIGPGLGRADETMELVRKFTAEIDKPLIIDADGIFAFKDHKEDLKNLKKPAVLTPHLGEMARLLDTPINVLKNSLISKCRDAAKIFQSIFVVKCETTIIAEPNGQVFLSPFGNPGMATGGTGDVLAGSIVGISQQVAEKNLLNAAVAGLFIHGRAGDIAYQKNGNGLIATDIIDSIPQILKELN